MHDEENHDHVNYHEYNDGITPHIFQKHYTIFYLIYVEWRLYGNGHCKEDSQWTMKTKNLNECRSNCQEDCKYILYDPRDNYCSGYNSSTCSIIYFAEHETWVKGIYSFVKFKMYDKFVLSECYDPSQLLFNLMHFRNLWPKHSHTNRDMHVMEWKRLY